MPSTRFAVLARCLGVAIVLLLALPTHARSMQLPTRSLRLRDYFALENATRPVISPDGSQVAFVRSVIVETTNQRHSEIWVAPTDGTSARRLTNPAHDASDPIWSPDGSLLAFRSHREPLDGGQQAGSFWFLDMRNGGEAFQIDGVLGRPNFSPDGRWIVFAHPTVLGGEAATTNRSGRSRYELVDEFEAEIDDHFDGRIYDWMGYRFDRLGYLPDPGDQLAAPPRDLYIVVSGGGEARRLSRLGVDVTDISWDRDSEHMVFAADEHQRDEHTYARHDLWAADLSGNVTRLTNDDWDNRAPRWSPDGESIVFRRTQGLDVVIASGQGHGSPVDLYRLAVDGGEVVNLTAGWDLRPGPHRLSSDGTTVYFGATTGGQRHLFALPAAGGEVQQITSGRRQLGSFSFTADFTRLAFTSTSASSPAEVYTASIDGSDEQRRSHVNDLLMSQAAIGPTRPVRFASADGTEIEGWVILPPGHREGSGPYPLIVSLHGGPHSAYGEQFSLPFQLWATAGNVVLYLNPRGSTGYGEQFLWATWGRWGDLDYQDVMAGVGYALETLPVDAERLGVIGYSYGGFLTNWIITHTDRFAAAISGAGISNWISDYGTSDIPRTKESGFYGAPWQAEAAARLWQQSPLKHAAAVSTPTLFLHGENDFRVPIEQGEQMYTALRKQNVAARFVRYPDASHGGWRPWQMAHRYLQQLRWWDQHLSGDRR